MALAPRPDWPPLPPPFPQDAANALEFLLLAANEMYPVEAAVDQLGLDLGTLDSVRIESETAVDVLGLTAEMIDNATALIGPPGMFTTADAGPGACPSVPQQYLVSVNTVNGNVWLCRAIDGVSREWTATNTRHLTYNSLLITG
mgnify:CR=1 FL=1